MFPSTRRFVFSQDPLGVLFVELLKEVDIVTVPIVHTKTRYEFHPVPVAFIDICFNRHNTRIHDRHQSLVLGSCVVTALVRFPKIGPALLPDFLHESINMRFPSIVADYLTKLVGMSCRLAKVTGCIGGIAVINPAASPSWG